MKWLITGGCGFIGINLIKKLLVEGNHSIRVFDNLSSSSLDELTHFSDADSVIVKNNNFEDWLPKSTKQVQIVIGDIRDKQSVNRCIQGADVIVHLAANTGVPISIENPMIDCETNIIGTLNLLECSRMNKVSKFIFASSGAPLGGAQPPLCESTLPAPLSPYGVSKLAGESYCFSYHHLHGINTISLRFGNVYGPGSKNKSSVVAKFIKNTLSGQRIEIYGDGTQTRDYIFIDDLVDAIVLSANASNKIGGETFQIATNSETSLTALTDELKRAFEKFGVNHVNVFHSEERKGDSKRNYSDISKAKLKLNWHPTTTLEAGLYKTIEYFLRENPNECV